MIPMFLFLVAGVVGVSFSPLGRALAHRLAGTKSLPEDVAAISEVEELRADVGAVRKQLEDVQERLDFVERLLAQARAKGQLGEGGS